jgi:TPR repeat protein
MSSNDASNDDLEYARAEELFQNFVRGDALIGLIPDARGTEKRMMEALWALAARKHAGAWTLIGDAHIARLRPIGAFEGVEVDESRADVWSMDARRVVDEDQTELEFALRAYYEASRLGHRDATMHFAKMTRHSNAENKAIARGALEGLADPTPAELYQLGLVQNWLGEMEASAKSHLLAAERGNLDAQFELFIYYVQGVGVEADEAKSEAWLDRAAAGNHPRALYNVGAAYASGKRGEPDLKKAAEYYKRAAEHGNARAASTLGVMILTGEMDGTKQEAIDWLNRADEGGYATWEALDYAGVDDPREESGDDEEEAAEA